MEYELSKMADFSSLSALEYELEKWHFEPHNLNTGLEQFEIKLLETVGSCTMDDLQFETFDWIDEKGDDISIEIAIVNELVDPENEDWEYRYIIYNE